ncbi:helix-turn-helix domain-containing protein [Rahnella sp. PCH160]|uniref:helix-turn-helix domain-containing protein n=1 Tax=Rahnella sp. PCH160 TaxID=3447928 RepID=UPI0039FCC78C
MKIMQRCDMLKLEGMINEITLWIADNINQRITIADVAARAGYSKWHLQRIFTKEKKTTIATWIRDKKLSSAAHDLIYTADTIIDISLRYGYDSQQSFTRSFSKKFNVSPCRFRTINSVHKLTEIYEDY